MNIFKLLNEDFKFDRKKDTPIYLFEAFAGNGIVIDVLYHIFRKLFN